MPRPPLRTRQIVDPMTAFQIVHILEGVIQRGTATVLKAVGKPILGRPLFGKTGTTSGPTNVWFIGGSQQVVAGVYMGFDRPRPMGGYAQGGTLAVIAEAVGETGKGWVQIITDFDDPVEGRIHITHEVAPARCEGRRRGRPRR